MKVVLIVYFKMNSISIIDNSTFYYLKSRSRRPYVYVLKRIFKMNNVQLNVAIENLNKQIKPYPFQNGRLLKSFSSNYSKWNSFVWPGQVVVPERLAGQVVEVVVGQRASAAGRPLHVQGVAHLRPERQTGFRFRF